MACIDPARNVDPTRSGDTTPITIGLQWVEEKRDEYIEACLTALHKLG